jgi:hypothetical protein
MFDGSMHLINLGIVFDKLSVPRYLRYPLLMLHKGIPLAQAFPTQHPSNPRHTQEAPPIESN